MGGDQFAVRLGGLLVVLVAMLFGCGEASNSPPAEVEATTTEPATTEPSTTEPATTEPAATEPAAAPAAAATTSTPAGGKSLKLIKVRDKAGALVEAVVHLLSAERDASGEPTSRRLGKTNVAGELVMNPAIECPQGCQVRVEAPSHFRKDLECATTTDPVDIEMTMSVVFNTLATEYKAALARGDTATAALIASELSARTRAIDVGDLKAWLAEAQAKGDSATAAIIDAEILGRRPGTHDTKGWSGKVYELAGKSFNVTTPTVFDPEQQAFVMTPTLVQKVRAYQVRHDLPQKNGQLDYPTLKRLSGKDIGEVMTQE